MDATRATHRLTIITGKFHSTVLVDGVDISRACVGVNLTIRGEGPPVASIDLLCEDVSVETGPTMITFKTYP